MTGRVEAQPTRALPASARTAKRGRRPLAIRHYLALLLGAALLPLLLLATGLSWNFATAQRERFSASVTSAANIVATAVDREIIGHTETLEALAAAPALTHGDLESFHRQASVLTALTGLGVILRDTDGRQLVNTLVPWGDPLPTRSSVAAWDRQVLTSRAPVVSDHYVGLAGGEHSFAVIVPVLREGQPKYLLHLAIPAKRMLDVLTALSLGPGWIAAVTDSRGVVLARSRLHEQRVGQPAVLARLPERGETLAGRVADVEGVERYYVATRANASNFIVITAAQLEIVEGPLRRSWWILGAVTAGLIGLSLLLAQVLGKRLAEAIHGLARFGEALRRGDVVAPVASPIIEVDAVAQALADAAAVRQAESAQQQLILNELDHRVKNTLATVQALTLLTAREAPDVKTYCGRMVDRLQSLSRTQELLRGAGGVTAELHALLQAELAMHDSTERRRVTLQGPPLRLPATAAAPLGMLFHELATNAAKYGCFSEPGGNLLVAWTLAAGPQGERRLELRWTEAAGPPVQPPAREGFGTQLIRRGLARQLQATVAFDYRPGGLEFCLIMPVPGGPAEIPGGHGAPRYRPD